MKLLFDHNLSPRLVVHLADLYPDSNHVYLLGLDTADDNIVWQYARDNDYIIVTKDSDFQELTMIRGFPPKVVWIRRGNCTTVTLNRWFVCTLKMSRHSAKTKLLGYSHSINESTNLVSKLFFLDDEVSRIDNSSSKSKKPK